jgi:cyclic lactone autoinducer peptide
MKKVALLKKIGNKTAEISIGRSCVPFLNYQPKPPEKLLSKAQANK